jgi:DNA-binding CsgD family transcriptional regulator
MKDLLDTIDLYDNNTSDMADDGRMIDNIRPGFYRGESVVKSHGQKLIELTEAGESSVSIAKKLGLKQQTVSNALNAIDKGIAGEEYKLSKPLKDLQIPKNQYSGKLLTENKELIEAIKKDAPTMSDKEIKAKYNIHKSTLKKIKDQNNITTRSSYLPEGTQKKSIPYKDRFTAAEKSAMYQKRKATETEEDRIRARERDKKYRDKIFKEYKMEPSSRTFYDDLWKDIARSANEGDRIKLIEGPKYSSGASYKDFQSRVFLDTKTNERFTYDTLKNYLNSGKLEGVTYDSVIKPYELKNKIANSGLKEEIQKAYFGDKYKPPSKFRAQNTFHVHHIGGVAADPFKVQLTFADQNLGLVSNKKFNTEWARLIENNAPLSERKAYLKFVKSKTGENIAQTLEFPEVGKTRTYGEIGTDMQKLLSGDKFKKIKGIEKLFSDAPMLKAQIPVLTDLFNAAKSIPSDVAKKSYFKAAGKALGLAFTPVMIYDTYKAFEQGKPILEALEQGLIGTNMIGGTKDILALKPDEKLARSVVKQDELKDLNVDMPMGFGFIEGPTPDTDMTLQEAKKKMKTGIERVQQERAQKESNVAANRANFFGNLKDKIVGIGPGYELQLAGGGIAGLSGGIDKGPQTTSMNPDSQGLRSLGNRVRNR